MVIHQKLPDRQIVQFWLAAVFKSEYKILTVDFFPLNKGKTLASLIFADYTAVAPSLIVMGAQCYEACFIVI